MMPYWKLMRDMAQFMRKRQMMMCHALFLAAVLSASSATNDLPSTALIFPDVAVWNYRPDLAVQVANKFITANHSDAIAALELVSVIGGFQEDWYDTNQKICLLCRLIFVASNPTNSLRAPMLGVPGLLPSISQCPSDWPYMPFAIVDEIPFSMTDGYSLFGHPELARDYLVYCVSNAVLRTKPYPEPTVNAASNALEKLFISASWRSLKWDVSDQRRSHEERVKISLRSQIENMKSMRQVGSVLHNSQSNLTDKADELTR